MSELLNWISVLRMSSVCLKIFMRYFSSVKLILASCFGFIHIFVQQLTAQCKKQKKKKKKKKKKNTILHIAFNEMLIDYSQPLSLSFTHTLTHTHTNTHTHTHTHIVTLAQKFNNSINIDFFTFSWRHLLLILSLYKYTYMYLVFRVSNTIS